MPQRGPWQDRDGQTSGSSTRASTGSCTWVRPMPGLGRAWIESSPAEEEDLRVFGA